MRRRPCRCRSLSDEAERVVQLPAATGTDYHSFFMSRLSEAYLMDGRSKEASTVAERSARPEP